MVESFGDARVRYQRNPRTPRRDAQHVPVDHRGARQVHDRLSRGRPARPPTISPTAVAILEADPTCGFVGGELREFAGRAAGGACSTGGAADPAVERFATPRRLPAPDLSRRRTDVRIDRVSPRRASRVCPAAHDAFATLVDRPFLMSILDGWSGAIIRDPLVWYRQAWRRRHPAPGDEHRPHPPAVRHLPRGAAGAAQRRRSRAVLLVQRILAVHAVSPHAARRADASLRRFVVRAWRGGLYNPRWSAGYGRKRLIRLMLTGSMRTPR